MMVSFCLFLRLFVSLFVCRLKHVLLTAAEAYRVGRTELLLCVSLVLVLFIVRHLDGAFLLSSDNVLL